MTGMAHSEPFLSSAPCKACPTPRGRESQRDKSLGELEGRVQAKAGFGLPDASDQTPVCLEIETKYHECPSVRRTEGISEVP